MGEKADENSNITKHSKRLKKKKEEEEDEVENCGGSRDFGFIYIYR